MNASDGYDGSATAFEGDTTLLVRSVPAGARIRRAVLTATPVAGPTGTLFEERIDLSASSNGAALGATKVVVKGTAAFVEVDFHKRRTLAAVTGSGLSGATLQADLGGVYVEINDKGAILTPTDPTKFTVTDGSLPGLTVGKFKLSATADLDVTTVTIRTTPANLTVRLGKMPPFWARAGELSAADSSPDFAALLQTFLATATVENGFYLVPLVVHSDTLARLAFTLDLDYLDTVVATPNGLSEITLPYGPGTVDSAPAGLSVSLPPNAHVVAGATTARVAGQFAATRIVDGHGAPTGPVNVAGTALATPTTSLAQIVDVAQAFSASAIDLSLTGVTRTAQLGIDLRADLDGKPDGTSLLGGPVQFTLQSTPTPTPTWVSVPLASAFHFASVGPARYWIVLQSLDGQVTWNTAPASATTASLPVLQQTTDGGLSWRATALSTGAATQNAPFTTLYRFRYLPDKYQVPIELQVGSGDAMTRVKLDRFAPLSRVDFTLDVPEVADGFNTYLGKATPATCSQAEHLANGDFRQWQRLGTNLGTMNTFSIAPTGPLLFTPDGQYLYAGASTNSGAEIDAVEVLRDIDVHRPIALGGRPPMLIGAVSPDGTRAYLGTSTTLH
ncbi:MAG: hypothetical protein JO164_00580, partial [Candidatus Eremiobacteraeota bacterium]|nr:hypothetical protein [Candidatus Eremiobacteraeota bacterium]